jgi:hypothetical protein
MNDAGGSALQIQNSRFRLVPSPANSGDGAEPDDEKTNGESGKKTKMAKGKAAKWRMIILPPAHCTHNIHAYVENLATHATCAGQGQDPQ